MLWCSIMDGECLYESFLGDMANDCRVGLAVDACLALSA
jgi:hypothetical protein